MLPPPVSPVGPVTAKPVVGDVKAMSLALTGLEAPVARVPGTPTRLPNVWPPSDVLRTLPSERSR